MLEMKPTRPGYPEMIGSSATVVWHYPCVTNSGQRTTRNLTLFTSNRKISETVSS